MEEKKLLVVNLSNVEIYGLSNVEKPEGDRLICTSFLRSVNGGVSQSYPTITITKDEVFIELSGSGVRGTYFTGSNANFTLIGHGTFHIVPGTYTVYVQGSIFGDGEIKSIVHYNE